MIPLKDRNPTVRTPVVTVLLIVLNVGVFFFIQRPAGEVPQGDVRFSYEYAAIPCELVTGQPLSEDEIARTFNGDTSACDRGGDELTPSFGGDEEIFPDKNVWLSVLFSMFLHGGWLHLGGNMLFLWTFGNNIEDKLGWVPYLVFYLLGGVVAAAGHVLVDPNSTIPVVGASGAVAAVMGAYLVWFPRAPILTLLIFFLFIVREIPAVWLLGFWFVLQFFTGPDSGVAWMAHVGGFVFGVAVAFVLRGRITKRLPPATYYPPPADPWSPTWPDDRPRFGGRP
jgi:membrane associated rhomboid family serine protease